MPTMGASRRGIAISISTLLGIGYLAMLVDVWPTTHPVVATGIRSLSAVWIAILIIGYRDSELRHIPRISWIARALHHVATACIAAGALIIGIEAFRFGLLQHTTSPQIMRAQLGVGVSGMLVALIARLLLPEGAPHALLLPTHRRWRVTAQAILITGCVLVGILILWMIVSVGA